MTQNPLSPASPVFSPSALPFRRTTVLHTIHYGAAVLLGVVSISAGADLLKWDVTGSTGVTGSAAATGAAAGVSGTAILAGSGSTTGNATSPANTWNRSFPSLADFSAAMAAGNYFSFDTTAASGFTVSISGITGLNLSRTSSGPTSAGLFYSTDGGANFNQTGTPFTVGTALASAETAFSSTIATTPIVISGGNTVQWRIVVFGGTSNRLGIGSAGTVDFALTGTSVSASTHNLLWTGTGGSTWNTVAGNTNWANTDLGNAASPFANNDNVAINTPATITVAAGGVSPGNIVIGNTSGTISLSGGSITGVTLAKNGDGTLVLQSANTITGGSTLSGGITRIAANGSLGNQTITLSNATLEAVAPATTLSNSFILGASGGTIDNAADLSTGSVSNSTANTPLTKTGAGTLSIAGAVGTQTTGPINLTVAAGAVTHTGSNQVNIGTAAVLDGNLNLSGPVVSLHGTQVTGAGSIHFKNATSSLTARLNGGTVRIGVPIVLEADGRVDSPNGTNNLNINAGISGSFNFTKNGNGMAVISQPSTYTGSTTVAAGTLRLGNLGTVGNGEVILTQASSLLTFGNAAPLNIPGNISGPGAVSIATDSIAPVTLSGTNSYTGPTGINSSTLQVGVLADAYQESSIGASSSDPANITINSGELAYTGASAVTTDRSFTLGLSGGRLSTSGGTLNFNSGGMVAFSEPTQVVVGAMSTANFYKIMVLGNTDWAALGAPVGFTVGTIFKPNGPGSGTGEVVFANPRFLTLQGSAAGTNVLSLILTDPQNAPLGINKSGSTTWSLTANENTYTGSTNISGGILRFDAVNPAVTGNVTVLNGGSLGGNGSVGAAVTLQSGGGLATKISNWTGVAGVGYDDLSVASLNAASVPMTVVLNTTGITNFTEVAKSFTILNTTGGITNFNPANVTVTSPGFPGTGTWSLAQSGNSLVLSYALAAANPYLAWATGAPYNLAGSNAFPSADPDKDGIANSVEFVIGGNPATVPDLSKLPTSVISGPNLVFTYRRSDISAYLNPTVQYGSGLTGWTTAQHGTAGVTITSTNDIAPGIDQVVVTIPLSLGAGGKLFARLNVVVP